MFVCLWGGGRRLGGGEGEDEGREKGWESFCEKGRGDEPFLSSMVTVSLAHFIRNLDVTIARVISYECLNGFAGKSS